MSVRNLIQVWLFAAVLMVLLSVTERWRRHMMGCGYALLAATCLLGTVLSVRMYRKSSPGAMRAAADIAGQYV